MWGEGGMRLSPTVRALVLGMLLCGCQRGCARTWLGRHGVGEPGGAPPGGGTVNAIDCPDGLARCVGGVVEVSRLATIPTPCVGRPEGCRCPWERVGDCSGADGGDGRCVIESEALVMARPRALAQLCAPSRLTGIARPAPPSAPSEDCEEGVAYRCSGGRVISCESRGAVGVCERGCAAEGSDIGAEISIDREGAFAILCSR